MHRHTSDEEFRDCGSIDTLHCLAAELFTANLSGGQATDTFRDFSATLFRNIREGSAALVIFDRVDENLSATRDIRARYSLC